MSTRAPIVDAAKTQGGDACVPKSRHARQQRWATPLIISLFAGLLGSLPISPLHAQSHPVRYVATVWQTEQGLPQNTVNAMLQDSQGYIWIGTFGGLARFDGERFTVFVNSPGFSSARILALHTSRSGDLWIGTVDGGLVRMRDGVATKFSEPEGLPSSYVSSIREDADGKIWINTARGIARLAGTQIELYPTHHGRAVDTFYLQERDGSMWFRSQGEVLRFGADGSTVTLADSKRSASLIGEARDGSVWIGFPGEYRIVRHFQRKFTEVQLPTLPRGIVTGEIPLLAMGRDTNEDLVLLTPAGLVRVVAGKIDPPEPLPWPEGGGVNLRSLLIDREGNRWVGMLGSGLIRFRRAPLRAYGKQEGLSDQSFRVVFQDREGRMWLGGDLLYWADERGFHLVPGVINIRTIIQTGDGDLWIGGYSGLHRWRLGTMKPLDANVGIVGAIYQDRQGTVWIGSISEMRPGGLFSMRNGKWEQTPGITDVRAIIEDRDGGLWLSGLQGLFHLRAGKLTRYGQDQGLSSVSNLYRDSQGTLWLATYGAGLVRFRDGQFRALTSKEGLPNNMLVAILEDDAGHLWLGSNQNIFRFTIKELNDFFDAKTDSVSPISYGISEGMTSSECNSGSPSSWRTPDGQLWFATLRGVVAIDSAVTNPLPPPVAVEEAWAGKLALERDGLTSAPPGNNTFDFRFTALSFSAPEKVRFRYRLEPYQRDWIEAGTRRTAHYTNMAPGKYLFRVMAANNDGVWNTQGTVVQFVLQPHFYQTNWFRALSVLLILGLVWAAHLLRVRQLHHQFELSLDARVGERTRIARELHDTLLQSFHGLLLRFQTVSQLLPGRPTEAKERLDNAIDQAAEAITEGRDAVQGLRASTVQGNDLAEAISTLGEELATDSTDRPKAALQVAVEGQARNLHPIVRDEIYRIAVEALRNAFRHAEPRRVEVEIRYAHDEFRMRVRDDGKGVDPAVLAGQGAEGHYGLRGMRERATLIGGKLDVWSQAGAGAEVELRIPAGAAYASASKRGSRSLWEKPKIGNSS